MAWLLSVCISFPFPIQVGLGFEDFCLFPFSVSFVVPRHPDLPNCTISLSHCSYSSHAMHLRFFYWCCYFSAVILNGLFIWTRLRDNFFYFHGPFHFPPQLYKDEAFNQPVEPTE